jgi:hypothetical protein
MNSNQSLSGSIKITSGCLVGFTVVCHPSFTAGRRDITLIASVATHIQSVEFK